MSPYPSVLAGYLLGLPFNLEDGAAYAPKRPLTLNRLHGIIYQNMGLLLMGILIKVVNPS
jgi:hypothetical protein